jgi:hypothetical protein
MGEGAATEEFNVSGTTPTINPSKGNMRKAIDNVLELWSLGTALRGNASLRTTSSLNSKKNRSSVHPNGASFGPSFIILSTELLFGTSMLS